MIVDSSALISILFAETDAPLYAQAIGEAETRRISAANVFEVAINVDGQANADASHRFDSFIRRGRFEIVPVTEEHIWVARQAYRDFGKGNHPAGLNFGDCFAYALAKTSGEPLLFKGDDFAQTDIKSAA